MGEAFAWGLLAASSLVIGAVIALAVRIPLRAIGLVMGFGAGVLVSAVAFNLVQEATDKASDDIWMIVGIFAGCATFFLGDLVIDRLGGAERKKAGGAQGSSSALAIVLGTVLDGIPESAVIGLTVY